MADSADTMDTKAEAAPAQDAQDAQDDANDTKACPDSGRKSTRDRKKRDVYAPTEQTEDEKELVVPNGTGNELGEIENVAKRLGTYLATDKLLVKIHAVLFPGQKAQKGNRKSHIRKFKGFDKDDVKSAKESTTDKLEKMVIDDLKAMCQFCDIERSGTKVALVERITDFLVEPKSSGNPYDKGMKKKKASKKVSAKSKKRKADKADKPKKALTGYLYFSTQKSKGIRAKNAELSMGEVSKAVGAEWGKLDDAEKEEWKQKSIAAFEANGGAAGAAKSSTPKAKKAKKAKKAAPDSDESSDDEPLVATKGLGDKLEARLTEILSASDLSVTTRKIIRKMLEKDFSKDLIKTKKDEIKDFIESFIATNDEGAAEETAAVEAKEE